LPDGRALIAGGDDTTNIVRTAELYWKGTFSATGSLSVERKAPLVLLPDGRAAMFGGSNDYGTLATIEIYR
jgi:hypothetical protein